MDPFRVLKYLLILATGMFGLYGFTLVIIFVLAQLVSTNPLGAPYMAPLAPFNLRDFYKSIVYSKPHTPRRPELFEHQRQHAQPHTAKAGGLLTANKKAR
jgi:hypothetical protein